MLLVNTYVDESEIEGIGLFAAQDIPKGTVIWRLVPGFDHIVEESVLRSWPQTAQDYYEKYASLSVRINKYVLSGDNDRFTNHSDNPNRACITEMGSDEVVEVAARDIARGEELTEDYRLIDLNFPTYADELK